MADPGVHATNLITLDKYERPLYLRCEALYSDASRVLFSTHPSDIEKFSLDDLMIGES